MDQHLKFLSTAGSSTYVNEVLKTHAVTRLYEYQNVEETSVARATFKEHVEEIDTMLKTYQFCISHTLMHQAIGEDEM